MQATQTMMSAHTLRVDLVKPRCLLLGDKLDIQRFQARNISGRSVLVVAGEPRAACAFVIAGLWKPLSEAR